MMQKYYIQKDVNVARQEQSTHAGLKNDVLDFEKVKGYN
jgi:hypothetical protein